MLEMSRILASRELFANIFVPDVMPRLREEMPGCEYLLLKAGTLKFGGGGDVLLVISGPIDETGREPFGMSWDRRSVCTEETPCIDWRLLLDSAGLTSVVLAGLPGVSR
jgi:hypothetical protein